VTLYRAVANNSLGRYQ